MALHTKVALAIVLTVSAMALAPVQPVSAHCPGTLASDGRDYATGWQNVPSADGIYAVIQYVNPTVCFISQETAFSLEAINLCTDGNCAGMVQVGWIKERTDTAPKMYCEWKPVGGLGQHQFFPMSPQQQTYWWYQSGGKWYCALGTVIKIPGKSLGWTSGTYFTAQGETNSTHTQIGGYPPPASLLFWNMQYRAGAWYQTDLWDIDWESPYFVYEPTPGQMRNGTNLHPS